VIESLWMDDVAFYPQSEAFCGLLR